MAYPLTGTLLLISHSSADCISSVRKLLSHPQGVYVTGARGSLCLPSAQPTCWARRARTHCDLDLVLVGWEECEAVKTYCQKMSHQTGIIGKLFIFLNVNCAFKFYPSCPWAQFEKLFKCFFINRLWATLLLITHLHIFWCFSAKKIKDCSQVIA